MNSWICAVVRLEASNSRTMRSSSIARNSPHSRPAGAARRNWWRAVRRTPDAPRRPRLCRAGDDRLPRLLLRSFRGHCIDDLPLRRTFVVTRTPLGERGGHEVIQPRPFDVRGGIRFFTRLIEGGQRGSVRAVEAEGKSGRLVVGGRRWEGPQPKDLCGPIRPNPLKNRTFPGAEKAPRKLTGGVSHRT